LTLFSWAKKYREESPSFVVSVFELKSVRVPTEAPQVDAELIVAINEWK
jgi:hypothetical protein